MRWSAPALAVVAALVMVVAEPARADEPQNEAKSESKPEPAGQPTPAGSGGAAPTSPQEAPEPQSAEAAAIEVKKRLGAQAKAAMALYRAGRYEEAYPIFRAIDEEKHTLKLALYMARCQAKRGELLEARALYERVLSEAPAEGASESNVEARGAASAELAELRLRISTLAIDVRGPAPEEVTLFVDGEVWPIGEPREINPGPHEIEAIARSGARTSRSIDAPEGRALSSILRLGLFAPSASRSASPSVDDGAPLKWPSVASAVAFGVAGAALTAGSVTGFLVLGRGSFLGGECIERACSPSQREELHALQALGDVSTASFLVGGVGLVAGAAFLWIGRAPSSPGVVASAWPGGAAIGGRFE